MFFTQKKFGGGSIKYIIPVWMLDETNMKEIEAHKELSIHDFCQQVIDEGEDGAMTDVFAWMFALKACEWSYCKLTNDLVGKHNKARTVLPCAIVVRLLRLHSCRLVFIFSSI